VTPDLDPKLNDFITLAWIAAGVGLLVAGVLCLRR
jgi:hypothetical protein